MPMISAEERSAILETFQRLLADLHDESQLRQAMETDKGFDLYLWKQMGEIGIPALLVDPEFGGIGAGPVELELLMEEAGASLLCSPFLASGVIAASFIGQSCDQEIKERLLPKIASGTSIATVAITGDAGLWTEADIQVDVEFVGNEFLLSGVCSFVLHALNANILLVVALVDGEVGLFEVDPKAVGVKIAALPVNDPTLRLGRIELDRVKAKQVVGVGSAEFRKAMDIARVALAGESAGAARKIFEITVDYIANRYQFGRAVGGFQALKHMAADLLIEVESATSVARNAAETLLADKSAAASAVPLAAFSSADSFFKVAAQSIQMSGGIAFTMEYAAHLYWRRARTNLRLFGSSDFYREQYLVALESAQ